MKTIPGSYAIPARSLTRLSAAILVLFSIAEFAPVVHAADDEGAEIKLLVAPAGIDQAMKTLSLTAPAPKNYKIYFVDTADLKLISHGVILRLRDKGKKKPETETTVKYRPEDQSKAPDLELPRESENETEWLIGKGQNLSYSLKHEIKGTELLKNPSENLATLFSKEQKAFFKLITKDEFDPTKLKVFGPVSAEIWEWNEAAIGAEVSAESWKLGGERVFELSRKAKADHLKKTADEFENAFKNREIAVDPNPESKTRKALEYYSRDNPEIR